MSDVEVKVHVFWGEKCVVSFILHLLIPLEKDTLLPTGGEIWWALASFWTMW
jgi:hypothetical protein